MKLIEIIGQSVFNDSIVTFSGHSGELHSFVINVDEIINIQSWICDIAIDDESIVEPYNGECALLTYKDNRNCKGESQMAVFEPYRSLLSRLYEGKFFAPKVTRLDLISNGCDLGLTANYDHISNYEYEKFKEAEAEAKRNKNE